MDTTNTQPEPIRIDGEKTPVTAGPKRTPRVWFLGALLAGLLVVSLTYFVQARHWNPLSLFLSPAQLCDRYSGSYSYAWGDEGPRCEQAGCKYYVVQQWPDDPYAMDDEGADIKCVPLDGPDGPPGTLPEDDEILGQAVSTASVALGETFYLVQAGTEASVIGHDVRVRVLAVGRGCGNQTGPITMESITSPPVCNNAVIEKMVFIVGGKEHEVPVNTGGGTYSGLTVPFGDKIYRVVVKDNGSEVRVLELSEQCATGTLQEQNICWYSALTAMKDFTMCGKLQPSEEDPRPAAVMEDDCKRGVARDGSDPAACRAIADAQKREACLDGLAFGDRALCAETPSTSGFCACYAIDDASERSLCLERTIFTSQMTAGSPPIYCALLPWTRGPCALQSIKSGYMFCKDRKSGICVEPMKQEGDMPEIGIWNCVDLAGPDLEIECYKHFIWANSTYLARPQGIAICDTIRDVTRKQRCKDVMREEGLVE